MPTFYLDYEGGNDGNDGTTFANRWKTITSGATAARIAPGDTIRVMGSPAPTSLGINATWTNKSITVTLASALNVLITNCDTAWTASANVTSTADTTLYRSSTASAKHAIASGFTTGKVAYFDLGSNQDYSGYQGVTFWIHVTTSTLGSGVLTLDLCSDTVGATPVDTLSIPAVSQTGQWVPVHIDKGSALGSAIRSISINAVSDPGTITVYLDNISTTKAAGDDCLTLRSLISKNTAGEYWWALRHINGTALSLDCTPSMLYTTVARGYYGTTESVTTYKRETIRTDLGAASSTNIQAVQDAGTAGSVITFSGGWNRTDMTTQTLETWFDGQSGNARGIYTNGKAYLTFDKIHTVRYTYGYYIDSSNFTFTTLYSGHCTSGFYANGPTDFTVSTALHLWGHYVGGFDHLNGTLWTIPLIRVISCGVQAATSGLTIAATVGSGHWLIDTLDVHNSGYHGLYIGTGGCPSYVKIGTLTCNDNVQSGWACAIGVPFSRWRVDTVNCASNGAYGMNFQYAEGEVSVGTATLTSNSSYGILFSQASVALVIDSLITSGNTSGACVAAMIGGRTVVRKSSLAETTKLVLSSSAYTMETSLSFQNYNAVSGDHRTYLMGGGSGAGLATIFSESTVRHTASGLAWKVSINTSTYITSSFPIRMNLGRVSLAASVAKTITAWVRRTNTGITAKLVVRGGQLDGIATDQVATAAAAQDTWEQLSVNVNPSIAGVIDVELHVFGGSTYAVYVDDLGVS